MSTIKEILEDSIYPAIFQNPDVLLGEFQFKKTDKGYISTTGIKVNGETGKPGKVYIYSNNIGRLKDYTRESISIWDFIQRREKHKSNFETLKYLAHHTGVKLQSGQYNEEEYISTKRKNAIWEDVNSYLVSLFETEGKKEKEYMIKRGYTEQDLEVMEIGYMPSQERLIKHLKGLEYTPEEIAEIKLNNYIGTTHRLTIPLREPAGNIIGLSVRNINYKEGDKAGKYQINNGLNKTLFNISPLRDKKIIVIVEGMLDCLLAKARGINNVVALAGKVLTIKQLETAVKYGVEKIVLCLDNEEGTTQNTIDAIKLIMDNSNIKVYVAQLPDGVKDADELIRKQGASALQEAVKNPIKYYEYLLQHIYRKYCNIENPTAIEEDEFIEEIVSTAASIKEPIDRERYIKIFLEDEEIKASGISQQTLEATAERMKAKEDGSRQESRLKGLLDKAKKLQEQGNIEDALTELHTQSRAIKEIGRAVDFEKLLLPITEEKLNEHYREKPENLKTDYIIHHDTKGNKDNNEELLLPSGAITIIAAPTSHCKTTMLLNLAINTTKNYKEHGKCFHFFGYEEDRETITLRALNTYLEMDISANNLRSLAHYYCNVDNIADIKEKYKMFSLRETALFESKREQFHKLIDSGRLNIHYVNYNSDTLIEAVEYVAKRQDLGAVFIDYIQLLKKGSGFYKERHEELKTICMDIKDLSIRLQIPIVLGAQFNRPVVNHAKIHPTNIGEAGDIERVANTIIGLWNNNFTPVAWEKGQDKHYIDKNYIQPGTIYGKVLKNREGMAGREFLLSFDGNKRKINNFIK